MMMLYDDYNVLQLMLAGFCIKIVYKLFLPLRHKIYIVCDFNFMHK